MIGIVNTPIAANRPASGPGGDMYSAGADLLEVTTAPAQTPAVDAPEASAPTDLSGLGINGRLQINHPDAQAITDAFTTLAQNSPTFKAALKYAVEQTGVLTIGNEGLGARSFGSGIIDGNSMLLGDIAGGKAATDGVAFPDQGELYSTIAHELGHIIQNAHADIFGAKYASTEQGAGQGVLGNPHFNNADGNTAVGFDAEAYMADVNQQITANGLTPLILSPEGT